MGMTNEEYWYGENRLTEAFRKAQTLRDERMNRQMWVQGLYIYDAVAVAISNAFGKQGSRKQTYLKEPFNIHPKKQTPEDIRKQLVEELNEWKDAFDAKQKDEEWKLETLNTP